MYREGNSEDIICEHILVKIEYGSIDDLVCVKCNRKFTEEEAKEIFGVIESEEEIPLKESTEEVIKRTVIEHIEGSMFNPKPNDKRYRESGGIK